MKTSIKSSAILLAFVLMTTGAFAAKKVKADTVTSDVKAWASVNYYANSCGLDVALQSETPGNATLTVYDGDGNVVMTDEVTLSTEAVEKNYLLTGIADGDYTIEVTANNKVIEKTIALSSEESDDHLYEF